MHSFTAKMLLWFSVLVLRVFCQDCNVQNGKDGLDGKPGRDGRAGAKGDKGDPSESVLYELKGRKGDAGDKGLIGEQGLKGLPGEVGLMGPPGVQGIKGLPAMKTDRSQERQSAFSVQRTNTVIEYGKPLTFQKVLSNHNTVFNSERSKFICKEPGVYYFVFHAMPSGNLCLKIKSDALETEGLGFCEYGDESRGNTPVLSGGVVLKLRETQAVWLEVFKENDKATYKDLKSIVVTGFMI